MNWPTDGTAGAAFQCQPDVSAVSMGTYLRILAALHLQDDINLLAADDKLGRKLQDIELDSRTNK